MSTLNQEQRRHPADMQVHSGRRRGKKNPTTHIPPVNSNSVNTHVETVSQGVAEA